MKRKFQYRQTSDVSESTEGDDSSTNVKTTILKCNVLSTLVDGLDCSLCGCRTLVIRSVGCNLGLVCLLETYCTSCESVLNSTYSSDRVSGVASSNVPFFGPRSVVSANMDMGVGHGGLVKLCRHLVMSAMSSKTYTSHVKVIASGSMVASSSLLDDAMEVVRNRTGTVDSNRRWCH